MTDIEHGRDARGRWVQGVESVERDAEAMRLRARGWSMPRISRELGYGDEANVRRALKKHTERVTGEAAAELRQASLDRLDYALEQALRVMETRHFLFHNGRLCTMPASDGGEPVPVLDDGPVLAAIDRVVRIEERRAKLLGTDAPTRQEVEATLVRYQVDGVDMGKLQ